MTSDANKGITTLSQLAAIDEQSQSGNCETDGDDDDDTTDDRLDDRFHMSFGEALSQAKQNLSITKVVIGNSFGSASMAVSHVGGQQLSSRESARLSRKALQTMALARKFSELRPAELLKAITAIAESVAARNYGEAQMGSDQRGFTGRDARGKRIIFQRSRINGEAVVLLAEFLGVEIPPHQLNAVARFLQDIDPSGNHHCRMLARLITIAGVKGQGREILKAGKLLYVDPPVESAGHPDSLAIHHNEDVMLIAEQPVYPGDTWGPQARHKRFYREKQWNDRFAPNTQALLGIKFKEKKEIQREKEWERLNFGGWKVVADGSERPLHEQMGLPELPTEVSRIMQQVVRYNVQHYIPMAHVIQKLNRAFPYGELDNQAEVRDSLQAAGLNDASLADGRKVGEYLKRCKQKTASRGNHETLEGLSLHELMDGGPHMDGGPSAGSEEYAPVYTGGRPRELTVENEHVMFISQLVDTLRLVATRPTATIIKVPTKTS